MIVHRAACPECDGHVDYLSRSDEFERCPFCGSDLFGYDGTMGVVTSVSDNDRAVAEGRWVDLASRLEVAANDLQSGKLEAAGGELRTAAAQIKRSVAPAEPENEDND